MTSMPLKILIVDDNQTLRHLLKLTFSDSRFELHEADSCLTALPKILKLKPDYVILDVMMPGELNGFQICSMVKSWPDTQSCKIILLTALTEQRDLENGQEAGADFYVTKPFSPKNLLSLIETAELSKTQGPP